MADEKNQEETEPSLASAEAADEMAKPAPTIRSEFDPLGWELPVICKDCDQSFTLPYRHFQPGVVFHCPHCRGSFVPNLPMYRAVREAFATFYGKRQRAQEEFARDGSDLDKFQRQQASELEGFRHALDKLARAMRPAGKMVKPKGLAAMFT